MVCAQYFQRVVVEGITAALPEHFSIPFETVGIEQTQDGVIRTRRATGTVDVLDADQPLSTVVTGIQITANGSHEGAEMQGAGG